MYKNIILLLLILISIAILIIISNNLDISDFENNTITTKSNTIISTNTKPSKTYFGIMIKKNEIKNPTTLNIIGKEEYGNISYYTGIGELLIPIFKNGVNCSYGPSCGKLKKGDIVIIPNNVDYTPIYQFGEYVIKELDE